MEDVNRENLNFYHYYLRTQAYRFSIFFFFFSVHEWGNPEGKVWICWRKDGGTRNVTISFSSSTSKAILRTREIYG